MLNFNDFKNCPAEYRGAPFWSLNDKFEKEELLHQINEMHKQGIGGFFMHPRRGNRDEYLGKDYMDAIKACVEEAEKLGMKAYLYDEDGFPSGNASGLVRKSRPEYEKKALVMHMDYSSKFIYDDNVLAVFSMKSGPESPVFENISHLTQQEINKISSEILVFKQENQGYADLCFKDAVDEFIKITHEKYKKELGGHFGKTIPGIFTDEPHFRARSEKGRALPWTYEFQKKFMERKGYDILNHLPKLFFDTGNYKKVRFDFWDVISRLFTEAFSKTVYDWCEENSLNFTGHYWEHTFPSPAETGTTMPNYEYMQYPGIDMLFNTETVKEQVGFDMIVKEVSSVGNQLGKKRVLSETFGASGWDMDFESQKRIADWQFALGINFMCQHLVHYSLKGLRKRDFPLSFSYHQPWWDTYRKSADYLGRLSYVMSQGKYPGDLLLLHSSSSIWPQYRPSSSRDEEMLINPEAVEIGESLISLSKMLNELHYLYDLGDEIIMERHAKVEDGKLIVGKMSYSTVVMPLMTVLRSSTFKLLKQFVQNGGRIIACDKTPVLLDGEDSIELVEFFNSDAVIKVKPGKDEIQEVLGKMGNQRIEINDINGKETSSIYCHKRICGDQIVYFTCNFSKHESFTTRLKVDGQYMIEEWDAATGEKKNVRVFSNGSGSYVELGFIPGESHLLILDKSRAYADIGPEESYKEAESIYLSPGKWKVQRNNYNALTLKLCRYKDGGEWSSPEDVLVVDSIMKRRIGVRPEDFRRQAWSYSEEEKNVKIAVELKYTFNTDGPLNGDLYAAIESPEEYEVFVNGNKASSTGRYYHDRAFVMHDIKDYVKPGENEVILVNKNYNVLSAIESIYIVGDFRLKGEPGNFALTSEKTAPVPGDWTRQGYPYYSGKMSYRSEFVVSSKNFRKVELQLGKLWMISARVLVNGKEAAIIGWKPYKADITAFVKEGVNEITVEVMNSLRNLLGPHSRKQIDGLCTPGSFYYEGGDFRFVESGFSGNAVVQVYE